MTDATSKATITGTADGAELHVKRMYLPGVVLTAPCATCGEGVSTDFDTDYLSYPTVGEPKEVTLYHEVEESPGVWRTHETVVKVRLRVGLEVVGDEESAPPPLDVAWDDLPDPDADDVAVLKRHIAELEARERELLAMPLTIDREALGRKVREVWVGWAQSQSTTRAARVTPWEELPESIREGDRRVGEAIAAPFLRAAVELLTIAERATMQRDEAERRGCIPT